MAKYIEIRFQDFLPLKWALSPFLNKLNEWVGVMYWSARSDVCKEALIDRIHYHTKYWSKSIVIYNRHIYTMFVEWFGRKKGFVLFCFSILVRKHQTFHTLVDWSQTRMFAPKRVFTKVLFTHHGMHSIVQSITLKSIYNKIWVHPSMQFETHISCAKFQHKKQKSKSLK